MSLTLKTGDTLPALRVSLATKDGALDLTAAASVELVARAGTNAPSTFAMAIVGPATAGVVEYAWQDGDTDVPGVYQYTVRVIFSDGNVRSFPSRGTVRYTIEASLDQ